MRDTAIVTGASGGIGRAICEALAPDWDVAVHYHRDESAAAATADAIEGTGADATVYRADLSEPTEARGLVERAIEDFGAVHGLVNCAGVFYDAPLDEYDRGMYARTFGVNVEGAVECTRVAVEHMRERDAAGDVAGRVVGIASTAGTHGTVGDPVYAATKGALVAFTKSIARTYAENGIIANVVAPGPTDTGMLPPARAGAAAEATPLGRIADPEEVAETVACCLDTTFVTGQVIEVNGGLYT